MAFDTNVAGAPTPVDKGFDPKSAVEQLREAQSIARIGSWFLDLLTGAVHWSPEMYAVYGQVGRGSPEECLATVLPDDRQLTEAAFATMVEQRAPMDIVHRVQHSDGSVHHIQVLGQVRVAEDGQPVGAQGTAQDVTAQLLRETALRSSEAFLRTVFATMAEGLVTQDADGRVVDGNEAAQRILGLSRDELLGRTSIDPRWRSVREDGTDFPGDEHPSMVALRSGMPQHDRIMGVVAPGQGRRWIRINATPLRAGAGAAPSGVVSTFADVTEEVELRHRQAQLAAELSDLYDHAPCGYHSLDASGRYLRINDIGLSWLGVTREEAIGRLSPADFLTPESLAQFTQRFPRIRAGETVEPFELDLMSRDGTQRRVRAEVSLICDGSGGFVATRTVLHDITDLHRTQLALERLASEQQAMLDTELIGLVRVRDRRFTWVSRGLEAMFGVTADELLGQPTRPWYTSDADHARMGDMLAASRQAGTPLRGEFSMKRKDGRLLWLDIGVAPVQGSADEWVALFVDITATREAADMRLRASALDAENQLLHETDRLKGQFLANMSHELRTPLNAVIGLAHLLESGFVKPDAPKFSEYLAQIGASGRHLTQLVDTMLGYANLESKRLELHPAPVDMLTALQDAIENHRAGQGPDAASKRVTVNDAVRTVVVDPLRLRQVLVALIDNAVKFSPPGAQVEIRVLAEDAARFRIEVQDTGIGIAEPDLPRLFAPFVQLSAGSTKTHPGLGMGLALVRRIVQAQGGSVSVQSRLGEGSTFHVILPRAPSPAA